MQKGETITSIGGMSAADWFADQTTYFLNLSAAVIGTNQARFDAAVDAAISGHATGLILDMRGTKALGTAALLSRRLICSHFSSMTFNIPVCDGPDNRSVQSSHYEVNPLNPYCGPLC
jgi:hypothetical protein